MKVKQKIAWILTCIMLVQLIPLNVFANAQAFVPYVEVADKKITHTKDPNNVDNIRPAVTLVWDKPRKLEAIEDQPTDAMGGDHEVGNYQVELYNYASKQSIYSKYIAAGGDKMSQKLEDLTFGYDSLDRPTGQQQLIDNGTFYRAFVHARHTHKDLNGNYYLAPSEPGSPVSVYFITDFDTKVSAGDEGLDVDWEYIPGASYRITYVAADKTTKQGVIDSDIPESEIIVTDSELIKANALYTVNGKTRVRYTLKDVKPKQIYSMYVEVAGFERDPSGQGDKILINKATDATGPKVVQGIPGINIDVYNIGKEEIEIYWGEITWATLGGNLAGIKVYAREEDKPQHLVAEKMGDNIQSIILDEPIVNTYYQVAFVILDKDSGQYKEIRSREKLYVPVEMRVQPLNPTVPKPYGPNLDISLTKKDYLVTGDTIPLNDPNFIDNTFHPSNKNGTQIQLVWDAPKVQDKEVSNEIDYDLFYDIWISDDLNTIQYNSKLTPVKENLSIKQNDTASLIKQYEDENTIIGMKTTLENYTDMKGVMTKLKANKAYYIKIVAKRQYGTQYVTSQPTIVSINIDKDGNISVPPVMGKPPLRIKKENGVTQTTVTLEWRTLWYEMIAKNLELYNEDEKLLAEIGSTKVYTRPPSVTTGPAIHFKYEENWKEHLLLTEADVSEVKREITESVFDKDYYSRKSELEADVQYELKVMPYDEVEKLLGAGQSIENWVATSQKDNTENWQTIKPIDGKPDDRGLVWKEHMVQGLKPNTCYMMMVRAYRVTADGEKLTQSFPSYIMATTLTDYVGPEPIPTVPNLQLDSFTDTAITVWWKYNKDFDYELVYSTKDDPNTAIKWDFAISNDPKDPNYVPDGEKAYVTINGLFPQTTYNVWIKAKQKKGDKVSDWSNPVTVKTKDIQVPDVPTGLGPAAQQSLIELNQTFKPLGPDYITVEWTKNPNDLGKVTEGKIEKYYEYDLEFADNVEFLDSIVVTVKDELGKGDVYDILSKSIVKFNKLIANRPYYVRVKARIVLKETELNRTISKESEYSKWVRIFTKTSEDEYDGGENENVVIYPDAIVEDFNKGEWTWEIVDSQKIISHIKTTNDYFYTIKLEKYRNRYDAHLRHIKIPVTVMQALVTSRMELRIVTAQAVYEIPASTLQYYMAKAGAKDIVQIDLETKFPYDIKDIAKPYPYTVMKAEEMRIFIKSSRVTLAPMKRFDGNVKVKLKIDPEYSYSLSTFKTYTYDYSNGGWVNQPHTVENQTEATYVAYSTPSLGIYTLYRIDTYNVPGATNYAMDQLLGNYHIEKLGTKYTKNQTVYSDQFINLILGIAQDYVDIDLDARGSSLMSKAKAAGIYIESASGNLTQEQAVHGVVRLYELKYGYRVKPSSVKFEGVSSKYSESVSKAYALGVISDITPKATVTYGELCQLIMLVLP